MSNRSKIKKRLIPEDGDKLLLCCNKRHDGGLMVYLDKVHGSKDECAYLLATIAKMMSLKFGIHVDSLWAGALLHKHDAELDVDIHWDADHFVRTDVH